MSEEKATSQYPTRARWNQAVSTSRGQDKTDWTECWRIRDEKAAAAEKRAAALAKSHAPGTEFKEWLRRAYEARARSFAEVVWVNQEAYWVFGSQRDIVFRRGDDWPRLGGTLYAVLGEPFPSSRTHEFRLDYDVREECVVISNVLGNGEPGPWWDYITTELTPWLRDLAEKAEAELSSQGEAEDQAKTRKAEARLRSWGARHGR